MDLSMKAQKMLGKQDKGSVKGRTNLLRNNKREKMELDILISFIHSTKTLI